MLQLPAALKQLSENGPHYIATRQAEKFWHLPLCYKIVHGHVSIDKNIYLVLLLWVLLEGMI